MNFFIDAYDESSQIPPALLNNERYTPALRAAWAFLPKTQIFVEASSTFANFRQTSQGFTNADSWVYTGSAGMNGIITPKISALAKVGFTGINTNGRSSDTNITSNTVGAQLEGTWDVTPTSKFRLGGARTIEPTNVFLFSKMWKAYLRYDQLFASRFNMSLGAEYDHLIYGRPVSSVGAINGGDGATLTTSRTDDGSDTRKDDVVQASIAFAYYISDFITLSLVNRVDYRMTNFEYSFPTGQPAPNNLTSPLPAKYITNDVFLRLGIRY
ncbi:MAG: outer membrane beta-barrel protein [Clostridia bacterium]|nr:outer membrane beta-barrel protein [Deltaproteobacteria bacterium]